MNSSLIVRRFRLAQILESVARETLCPEEALREIESWEDVPWEKKLWNAAWHNLRHFQSDKQIRLKDPSYASGQRDILLRIAGILRKPGIDDDEKVPGEGFTISLGTPKMLLVVIVLLSLILLMRLLR
jgi:hypothetical protein